MITKILYSLFFISGAVYVYCLASFYRNRKNTEKRVRYYNTLKNCGYIVIGTWIINLVIILIQIFCYD